MHQAGSLGFILQVLPNCYESCYELVMNQTILCDLCFEIIVTPFCLCIFFSVRYLDKLGRHNYVTPTSYLELISSLKTLLGKKQDEVCHSFQLHAYLTQKLFTTLLSISSQIFLSSFIKSHSVLAKPFSSMSILSILFIGMCLNVVSFGRFSFLTKVDYV